MIIYDNFELYLKVFRILTSMNDNLFLSLNNINDYFHNFRTSILRINI